MTPRPTDVLTPAEIAAAQAAAPWVHFGAHAPDVTIAWALRVDAELKL